MEFDCKKYIQLQTEDNTGLRSGGNGLDSKKSSELLALRVLIESNIYWSSRDIYLRDIRQFENKTISGDRYQMAFYDQFDPDIKKLKKIKNQPESIKPFLIDSEQIEFAELISKIHELFNVYELDGDGVSDPSTLYPLSEDDFRFLIVEKAKNISY